MTAAVLGVTVWRDEAGADGLPRNSVGSQDGVIGGGVGLGSQR
jgi:hypothetical protein